MSCHGGSLNLLLAYSSTVHLCAITDKTLIILVAPTPMICLQTNAMQRLPMARKDGCRAHLLAHPSFLCLLF